MIVGFRPSASEADETAALQRADAAERQSFRAIKAKLVRVPAGQEERARKLLSHDPRVRYVEPNELVHATALPNDPSFGAPRARTTPTSTPSRPGKPRCALAPLHERRPAARALLGVERGELHDATATLAPAEVASLKRLHVDYGNANLASATITLSVYKLVDVVVGLRDGTAVGHQQDRSVSWQTTSPAAYVSPGGQVRFRVAGAAGSSFRLRTDLVGFTIDY